MVTYCTYIKRNSDITIYICRPYNCIFEYDILDVSHALVVFKCDPNAYCSLSFSCTAMVWKLRTSGGSACHLRSLHPPVLRVVQLLTLAVNESTDSHRSSNILSGLRVSSSYRRPPSPCKVKALTCTGTDSIQQYSDDPRKPQAPVEAIASLAPAATTCGKVGFVRQDLLHGLARIF